MSLHNAEIWVINSVTNVAEMSLNWLIQSTLLIVAALALAKVLSQQGSAVRSVIYRTTLVAVLLCPWVTWMLAEVGMTGWSIRLPKGWTVAAAPMSPEPLPTLDASFGASEPASATVPEEQLTRVPVSPPPTSVVETPAELSPPAFEPAAQPIKVEVPPPTEAVESELIVQRFALVAAIVVSIWLLVSFLLLVRLAAAWLQLRSIRQAATLAESSVRGACRALARELQVTPPEVLKTPFIPSPCLAGLRNPAVLLPESELATSLREVLIHELAHLKRHDGHWNAVRQLASAVFCFQPLLWWLSRQIETTAEEVCDDFVVSLGADRSEYAHQLVDIAESSTAIASPAGVGMVSLRSMLAQRVARIMDTSRSLSTRVGNLLLFVVLVGGIAATGVVGLVGLESSSSAQKNELPEDDDDVISVRGLVIDPDGQPVNGATVEICRWYWNNNVPKVPLAVTRTTSDGRFEIEYRKSQYNADLGRPEMWKEATILARAPGFGVAWIDRDELEPEQEPTLRLVHDLPITGRVVDLEGNALAGIKIQVGGLAASEDENLDPWLAALARDEIAWQAANRHLGRYAPYWPEPVFTDANGEFQVTGVGRERRVRIAAEGETIAYTEATIVSREMEPVLAVDGMPMPEWSNTITVYGANSELTAGPTQPITGTVKDAKTGEPLAGVVVEAYRMADRAVSARRLFRVESDAQGRFVLSGMPKGTGRQIIAVPTADQPYFMRVFDVPVEPGLESIELDLELHRGVWIKGRVTDAGDGTPVRGHIYFNPFRTNPYAQELPEFDEHGNTDGYQQHYAIDHEGNYRVVGLPGRAIVGVSCLDDERYPMGMGHELIEGLNEETGHFETYRNPLAPSRLWPHAMKEVNVAEDADTFPLDFELSRGLTLAVQMIGPTGEDVAGARVAGKRSRGIWQDVDAAAFEIKALLPGESRTLLFHNSELQLGKALRFTASAEALEPLTVALEPCATIRGRIFDNNEQPISGARIRFSPRPGGDFSPRLRAVSTDAEGNFAHHGILPGTTYDVLFESAHVGFKVVEEDLDISPGEEVDLGTIDITGDKRNEPIRTPAVAAKANSAEAAAAPDTDRIIWGRVVDDNGQPVTNANLLVVRSRVALPPKREWQHEQLGESRTNAEGRFQICVPDPQVVNRHNAHEWQAANVIVTAKGFASTWFQATEALESGNGLQVVLPSEPSPLLGQFVNLEGQPLADLTIRVESLASAPKDKLQQWLTRVRSADKEDKLPSGSMNTGTFVMSTFAGGDEMGALAFAVPGAELAYPMSRHLPGLHPLIGSSVTTNEQGRFSLSGLPEGQLARVVVTGENVARQEFNLVHLEIPSVSLGHETYHGRDTVCPLAPGITIEGRLVDQDGGAPIAGATVASYVGAGPQVTVLDGKISTKTDENGQFRLSGMPVGEGNQLKVLPTSQQPYLATDSIPVPASDGQEPVQVEIALRRGIFVSGRVVESESRTPLKAQIHYHPFADNEAKENYRQYRTKDRAFLGNPMGGNVATDETGQFRFVAIPGRGLLAVTAIERNAYCLGVGADEIEGYDAQQYVYTPLAAGFHHRLTGLDIAADADEVQLGDIELTRGRSVTLQPLDAQGLSLTGVVGGNRTPFPDSTSDNENEFVEVVTLRPNERRPVYLLHKQRQLAKLVLVEYPTNELADSIKVTLEPTAHATGKLVDEEGAPVAGVQLYAQREASDLSLPIESAVTDADGLFQFKYLASGGPYHIHGSTGQTPGSFRSITVAQGLQLSAGEQVDFGNVDINSQTPPRPVRSSKLTEARSPRSSTTQSTGVSGRVLDHNGSPVAGAEFYWTRSGQAQLTLVEPRLIGTSDQDGHFSIQFPRLADANEPAAWGYREWLAVRAPGHGFLVTRPIQLRAKMQEFNAVVNAETSNGIDVRLPPSGTPFTGQLINIDGQPIVGATVALRWFMPGNSPLHDVTATKEERFQSEIEQLVSYNEPSLHRALPVATTDHQGRFSLDDLGPITSMRLWISGTGFESTELIARHEAGEVELVAATNQPGLQHTVYSRDFTVVIGPGSTLEGVVTDADTGQPIEGAFVRARMHLLRYPGRGMLRRFSTRTDHQGRYRITGLPPVDDGRVTVTTRGQAPYVPVGARLELDDTKDRHQINFELRRGVWAEGRVYDKDSGQSFTGELRYVYYSDAAVREQFPGARRALINRYWTNNQGEFRVPVLPTAGVLAYAYSSTAPDRDGIDAYPRAAGASELQVADEIAEARHFRAYPHYLSVDNFHKLVEIAPTSADETIEVNMALVAGASKRVRIVDEAENELRDCWVYEARDRFGWQQTRSSFVEVIGLEPNVNRKVFAYHRERNLSGFLALNAESPDSVTLRMQPAGSAFGRIVDEGGPVTDAELQPDWQSLNHEPEVASWAPPVNGSTTIPIDENGRFRLEGLIAGMKYSGRVLVQRESRSDMVTVPYSLGLAFEGITVQAGEEVDLGDLYVGESSPRAKVGTMPSESPRSEPLPTSSAPSYTIAGFVALADGKPVISADVAIVATHIKPAQGGDLKSNSLEVLAEGTTDELGEFQLQVGQPTQGRYEGIAVIARKEGRAVGWQLLHTLDSLSEIELVLREEELVLGQLVDTEGQPATRVKLRLASVFENSESVHSVPFGGRVVSPSVAAWVPDMTTDHEGRFVVRGVPAGCGMMLSVDGSERFAPQHLILNTGQAEQRDESDMTYRSLVKNVEPGETAVFVLSPARVFEGQITYEDTGEPAPGARLTIWASQQEPPGSMVLVAGTADDYGRYRILPRPGIQFGINVYPPSGTPYLAYRTPFDESIRWEEGDSTREVNLSLRRGVLVKGRVTDTKTDRPVAGARVQYMIERANNPADTDSVLTGWQSAVVSDDEGQFQMTVLPGLGHLMVHAGEQNYALRELGSREVSANKPGGNRYHVHASARISPTQEDILDVRFALEPTQPVRITLLDRHGQQLEDVTALTRLRTSPLEMGWRGFMPPVASGFELTGLRNGDTCPVHFLEPDRRLGATIELSGDETEREVVLLPCGQAHARFVDPDGNPFLESQWSLRIVVTPGASMYDYEAARRGELMADSDFVSNVDRVNYWPQPEPDEQGNVTFPALIPGATYRLAGYADGEHKIVKEFSVDSEEALELGEIVLQREQ